MRLETAGLLQSWKNQFIADPYHCLNKIERETNDKSMNGKKKPLTLKSLSGAFLVLGIGCAFAIAAFIAQIVHHRIKIRNSNKIKKIVVKKVKVVAAKAPPTVDKEMTVVNIVKKEVIAAAEIALTLNETVTIEIDKPIARPPIVNIEIKAIAIETKVQEEKITSSPTGIKTETNEIQAKNEAVAKIVPLGNALKEDAEIALIPAASSSKIVSPKIKPKFDDITTKPSDKPRPNSHQIPTESNTQSQFVH